MEQSAADAIQRFAGYRANVDTFIQHTLAASIIDNSDYVFGSRRIDYYEGLLQTPDAFPVYDCLANNSTEPGVYEHALHERFRTHEPGMLVLIGGLGAGKSTAMRYLKAEMERRRETICATYPCSATCTRTPVIIDCLDLDRSFTVDECEAEVLMRIRRALYHQLLQEWFVQHGQPLSQLTGDMTKLLRRLLIANDLYHWADAEALEFPSALHNANLDLPYDLLSHSPHDWNLGDLASEYTRAVNEVDGPIEATISNIPSAKRFTALLIGFWQQKCHPQSPFSLIIVDNLDQQPTEHIEQIGRHLQSLDTRNRGIRILLPLRPSSIVPHGFTQLPRYMYHYGPNCFDFILWRLSKYVLSRSRDELLEGAERERVFARKPSNEDFNAFLAATYLYAWVCVAGVRGSTEALDELLGRPRVHPDYEFLHGLKLSTSSLQQLADTLEAVVGTCGRYATDQLLRYFNHIYAVPDVLLQIERDGIASGASVSPPQAYGRIVTAVLGAGNADSGVTGLANLYIATQVGANPGLPSSAKLRVLMFLAKRPRVRVKDIVAALASAGIPVEITIAALNYLHEKNRLLLWFSRNAELNADTSDLNQYVVISEHGMAYIRDLIGDFEYVWFCAQQIGATATRAPAQTFRVRLHEYRRLMEDFARLEWKQMTFRHCSSSAVWPLPTREISGDEMMTLFLLYSTLDRAMRGARIAMKDRDSAYVDDVTNTVGEVVDLILQRQDDYELYFGSNGYLVAYSDLIRKCTSAVEAMLGTTTFSGVRDKLQELLKSWTRTPTRTGMIDEDAVNAKVELHAWMLGIGPYDVNRIKADAKHALQIVTAAMRRYLQRRHILAEMFARRFPTYSLIDQELSLLLEDAHIVRDAAIQVSLIGEDMRMQLERECSAIDVARAVLRRRAFSVPDTPTMLEMDQLKENANEISTAFVSIARRLEAERTDHLDVRWSI